MNSFDDPSIPALKSVSNPVELIQHLGATLHWQNGDPTDIQVRMLRHHPGKRCVLEIRLRTTNGPVGLIGKAYARDRSDVYNLMQEIRAAGMGRAAEYSIPQAAAYLQPLQLLIQEKVEGQPATGLFLINDEAKRECAAVNCGRWLAKFHSVAPRLAAGLRLGMRPLAIDQWYRRLESLGEPFASKAGVLFRQLEIASTLQVADTCITHGDFTHHQLILGQKCTVTVDWDNYAMADPTRDVARFMVGLKRLALRSLGSIRALDEAAGIFLSAYAAALRPPETANLVFQKAAICLEHAKHDVHKRIGGWRQRAEATLDEGLRTIEVGT
jgi:aminoglycoside phosphotransferase (APT) family kinase protein